MRNQKKIETVELDSSESDQSLRQKVGRKLDSIPVIARDSREIEKDLNSDLEIKKDSDSDLDIQPQRNPARKPRVSLSSQNNSPEPLLKTTVKKRKLLSNNQPRKKDFFDLQVEIITSSSSEEDLEIPPPLQTTKRSRIFSASSSEEEELVTKGVSLKQPPSSKTTTKKPRAFTPPPHYNPTLIPSPPKQDSDDDLTPLTILNLPKLAPPRKDTEIVLKIVHVTRLGHQVLKPTKIKTWRLRSLVTVIHNVAKLKGCRDDQVVLVYNNMILLSSSGLGHLDIEDGQVLHSYDKDHFYELKASTSLDKKLGEYEVEDVEVEEEDLSEKQYLKVKFAKISEPVIVSFEMTDTIESIALKLKSSNDGTMALLFFDGEKLDYKSTVGDCDIEDGDLLEGK